jgi:hypothetical protein
MSDKDLLEDLEHNHRLTPHGERGFGSATIFSRATDEIMRLRKAVKSLRDNGDERQAIVDQYNGGLAFASIDTAPSIRADRDKELAEYDKETRKLCGEK